MSLSFRNLGQFPEKTAHVLKNLVSTNGREMHPRKIETDNGGGRTAPDMARTLVIWRMKTPMIGEGEEECFGTPICHHNLTREKKNTQSTHA